MILIAVTSCGKFRDRREAQLATWIPEVPYGPDTPVFFFVGKPVDHHYVGCVELDCPDDYYGMFKKTIAMLEWARREIDPDFLHKLDDDTYTRPERLLSSGFENHDYTGWTTGRDYYAQGGSGYWLSRRAIEAVLAAKAAGRLPDHPFEDCSIGNVLYHAGIAAIHDPRYQTGDGPRESTPPLPSNDIISLHRCDPGRMRSVHRIFKASQ